MELTKAENKILKCAKEVSIRNIPDWILVIMPMSLSLFSLAMVIGLYYDLIQLNLLAFLYPMMCMSFIFFQKILSALKFQYDAYSLIRKITLEKTFK